MIKIKQATADQIIGVDPNIYRHKEDIDWQSLDKATAEIKETMCYMKNKGIYREASFAAIRAQIYKWGNAGEIDVFRAKWTRTNRGTTLVNPTEVRIKFLSHPKWDLKVNQPDYNPQVLLVNRAGGKRKKTKTSVLQWALKLIRKILST